MTITRIETEKETLNWYCDKIE